MKVREKQELRNISIEELIKRLEEAKKELFNFRLQHSTGQLGNVMKIRETKRRIAIMETIINERAIEEEE